MKGGHPAWSPLGDGNASVERAEPTRYAREFAGLPHAAPTVAVTFVSGSADPQLLGGDWAPRALSSRSGVAAASLGPRSRRNRATAAVEVDPVTGRVTLGGQTRGGAAGDRAAAQPALLPPLARRCLGDSRAQLRRASAMSRSI